MENNNQYKAKIEYLGNKFHINCNLIDNGYVCKTFSKQYSKFITAMKFLVNFKNYL